MISMRQSAARTAGVCHAGAQHNMGNCRIGSTAESRLFFNDIIMGVDI